MTTTTMGVMGVPRYSDEHDTSDDPAWYHAPRASLQPALPISLLRKQESQPLPTSPTDSNTTAGDEPPASPASSTGTVRAEHRAAGPTRDFSESPEADVDRGDADDEASVNDEEEDDEEDPELDLDFFAPELVTTRPSSVRPSRSSVPSAVHVQVRPKGTSKLEGVKRISIQRSSSEGKNSDEELKGSSSRGSFGDFGRASIGGAGRESMLNYRPSDLGIEDIRSNLVTRDSLAVLAADPGDAGRLSRSSLSASRLSDAELPELLRAAKTGNLLLLKACLQDRGTDVTQRDAIHGQTALHLAVRHGQFAAVRMLCQKKTCKLLIDSVDARQNTPLHLAAARSRRVTKFLLEHGGADVSKVNSRNQTALGTHILTAKRDDPLITEMLLMHKADPNAHLDKSSLLHRAVDLKFYEIACRLVRYGARLDVKDENGKMIFDKVNRKILRQLINKISYPPVWVPDEERSHCMLCSRKFNKFRIGIRRHHCRHCGRICCGQCSHVSVESVDFPKTFEGRLKKGSGSRNDDKKRVCKTCSSVFKERQRPQEEKKMMSEFMSKIVGCSWEEVPGQQNGPRSSLAA